MSDELKTEAEKEAHRAPTILSTWLKVSAQGVRETELKDVSYPKVYKHKDLFYTIPPKNGKLPVSDKYAFAWKKVTDLFDREIYSSK